MHVLSFIVLAAEEAEPSKTPFYVLGGLLAVWAVVVSVVGLTQADFPRSPGVTRAVYAISLVLVLAAMGSSIVTA